jgi:ribonuclease HII
VAWIIGMDEAGYGPNLGPFVMSSVACRVPDTLDGANLWHTLRVAVRQGHEDDDGRILVDDSKVVYSAARGLLGLEAGVLATLPPPRTDPDPLCLDGLLRWVCPDRNGELTDEIWYRGTSVVPVHACAEELCAQTERFAEACAGASVAGWVVRSVVVCPPRFNDLLETAGSKGAILAHACNHLLRVQREVLPGADALSFFVDKHGGRNTYAAQIQDALPDGVVFAREEGMARSSYRVFGLERNVNLTFQPRADTEHFCVALASMVSKYLRELLMREFNHFWQEQVPNLKPTAGYPGDAARFLEAIRAAAGRLGLAERALWRQK